MQYLMPVLSACLLLAASCVDKPKPWRPSSDVADSTSETRLTDRAPQPEETPGDAGGPDLGPETSRTGETTGELPLVDLVERADGEDAADLTSDLPQEVEPDTPCDATCFQKECGDDGCGSSCGECEGDALCVAGFCVTDAVPCLDADDENWDGCSEGYLTEFRVNTETAEDQRNPVVAGWPDGTFVVVWQSCPIDMSEYEMEYQDGSGCGVFAQRYTASGQPDGDEFRVNTNVLYHQHSPSVAAFGFGFVVAWLSWSDGPGWSIFLQLFNRYGQKILTEVQASPQSHQEDWGPQVAALTTGQEDLVIRVLVTWKGLRMEGGLGILGQLFSYQDGSEFTPDTDPFDIKETLTVDLGYPEVNALADNRFLALWEADVGGEEYIDSFARFVDLDGPAQDSDEFLINQNQEYAQGQPRAVSTGDGGFLAAYLSDQFNPNGYGVMARWFPPDAAPLPPFPVKNSGGFSYDHPAPGLIDGVNPLIVWQRWGDGDPDYDGVFFQRYGENFTKEGGEVKVNVFEADYELLPRLATLGTHGFVVVWQTCPYDIYMEPLDLPGQDGHGCGVYARRFANDGTPLPSE